MDHKGGARASAIGAGRIWRRRRKHAGRSGAADSGSTQRVLLAHYVGSGGLVKCRTARKFTAAAGGYQILQVPGEFLARRGLEVAAMPEVLPDREPFPDRGCG